MNKVPKPFANGRTSPIKKTLIPLSFLLITSYPSFADSADTRQASLVDEVIVTATRTEKPLNTIPNMVTVIDSDALAKQIAISNDLSTILGNQIPSFSPSRQKMSGYGESLRGRSPLYLVDGVPQSNPLRDGSRDGHTIDPFMLSRIEVIHGTNAIHGLGASGGIINLVTKKPSAALEQSIRFETAFQEEDTGESLDYGVAYSLSAKWDTFDLLASVNVRRTGVGYDANGEVIGFDNTQGDTRDADTRNLFLKAGYNWGEQRLELTLNDYELAGNGNWLAVDGDIANGVPTTSVAGDIEGKAAKNDVLMMNLGYTHEQLLGHKLRVQLFEQEFSATYGGGRFATFQDPVLGPDLYDQSQNNSEKTGLKITLVKDDIAGLPLSVVYGIDAIKDTTYQSLIQTGRKWVPKSQYTSYAPFVQLEYVALEKITLTTGIRQEESQLEVDDFTTLASYNGGQRVAGGELDISETLYNVGGTYQISDTFRLFANYSEGFSMPDVGRVLRGINTPGKSVETVLDLEPIITENIEFGFEYSSADFSTQLSYYQSASDFGQRLQADTDGLFSVKREKTEIDGIEFRSQWFVSPQDTLAFQFAQSNGEFDSDQDGQVDTDLGGVNISPDRINLSWGRVWSNTIDTHLQLNHFLDRTFDDSAGDKVAEFDGYTTLDLVANAQVLSGTLSLGIQNLTNRDYYTYYSQTAGKNSRNFKGLARSVNLSFNKTF
ncbi:MAG: TonB-dependent receptor [Gammaproteobacteria bacterium]|nr:TonB-dependent receptor [Gammaproteobacteria bacterium]MBQ0840365.1 TonB-dependent receptor [Gammaproteobacteria bacterium]